MDPEYSVLCTWKPQGGQSHFPFAALRENRDSPHSYTSQSIAAWRRAAILSSLFSGMNSWPTYPS